MDLDKSNGEQQRLDRGTVGPSTAESDLDELYRRDYRRLVGLAMLLVDEREVAEEVVQDAFLALHRAMEGTVAAGEAAGAPNRSTSRSSSAGALRRPKLIANPEGFLRRCVVNGGRDIQRRRAVRRRTVIEPREPTSFRFAELDDVLARLPYRQRAALVLRYVEDLPEREIAAALDVRPSTVRTLVRRGLAQLKKEVGE